MGRNLGFDKAHAVEQATRLFWAKGYSNASLRELLKVMGIGESSFYHLFKSKEDLYLTCLKHYNDAITRRRLAVLESEKSAKRGVRKFFGTVLDELDDPKTPRVCLMAGSLSADVLDVSAFQEYVVGEMNLFESAFTQRLKAAKKSGELSSGFSPAVAAQILITYLQGLFRVVRVLKDRHEMEKQIETLLASLGL